MDIALEILKTYQSEITILVLIFCLTVLVLWFFSWLQIRKMKTKMNIFLGGKNGNSLEDLILDNVKALKTLDGDIQELYSISNKIHALANCGLHKIGTIRFNPFKDMGGDQSFSVAFLDGKNSGVVFTSLHMREGTRVYFKPVIKGNAESSPLTEEEKEAIKTAVSVKQDKSNT